MLPAGPVLPAAASVRKRSWRANRPGPHNARMDSALHVALRHASGQLMSEQLPMAAAELLVDGHDSPALCELAGCSGREPGRDLDELLRHSLAELGIPYPEAAEAERWLLRDLAARLHAGEITPLEAGATMWNGMAESAEDEAELRFLRVAVSNCCRGCLEELAAGSPPTYRRWEDELRAAAADLAGLAG